MSGKVIFIPFSFLLISSFKQYSPGNPALESILSAYKRFDRLFNKPNTSSIDDSVCMAGFKKIISVFKEIHGEPDFRQSSLPVQL